MQIKSATVLGILSHRCGTVYDSSNLREEELMWVMAHGRRKAWGQERETDHELHRARRQQRDMISGTQLTSSFYPLQSV